MRAALPWCGKPPMAPRCWAKVCSPSSGALARRHCTCARSRRSWCRRSRCGCAPSALAQTARRRANTPWRSRPEQEPHRRRSRRPQGPHPSWPRPSRPHPSPSSPTLRRAAANRSSRSPPRSIRPTPTPAAATSTRCARPTRSLPRAATRKPSPRARTWRCRTCAAPRAGRRPSAHPRSLPSPAHRPRRRASASLPRSANPPPSRSRRRNPNSRRRPTSRRHLQHPGALPRREPNRATTCSSFPRRRWTCRAAARSTNACGRNCASACWCSMPTTRWPRCFPCATA